jgi:hypothetical protein
MSAKRSRGGLKGGLIDHTYYLNPYISNQEYTMFWLKLAVLCIEQRKG